MALLPTNPGSKIIDTIRLSDSEIDQLQDLLDMGDMADAVGNRRQTERFSYHLAPRLLLELDAITARVQHHVVPLNISEGGVGVVLGTFVYEGSRCCIEVVALDNSRRRLKGTIARCQHLRGRLHLVGIQFDESISLTKLIGHRAQREGDSQLQLAQLVGHVLFVDGNADDRTLLRFMLTQAGLKCTATERPEDLAEYVSKMSFDAIVINLDMDKGEDLGSVRGIREAGFSRLLVGITCRDSSGFHDEALLNGCDHVLVKPGAFEELPQLLAQFLPHANDGNEHGQPLESTRWNIAQMRPLILEFLRSLEKKLDDLFHLVEAEDSDDEVTRMLMDLKGSAGGYGYESISERAQDLISSLSASEADQRIAALDGLRRECQRAIDVHRK